MVTSFHSFCAVFYALLHAMNFIRLHKALSDNEGNQDKDKCVEFWRKRNVLHAVRTCPVGKPMSLSFSETKDRYRCTSNSCKTDLRCKNKTYGLTKGTWLEQSNLSLRDATLFIYMWAHEQSSIKNCARELEISRTTVINWNMYLREVRYFLIIWGQTEGLGLETKLLIISGLRFFFAQFARVDWRTGSHR